MYGEYNPDRIKRIGKNDIPEKLDTGIMIWRYLFNEYIVSGNYDAVVVYWKDCPIKIKKVLQRQGISVINKDKEE